MRYKIYFSVGGYDFDAEKFSSAIKIPDSRVTQIGQRSLGTPREREFFKHVWESRVSKTEKSPELAALHLMTEIWKPLLDALSIQPHKVTAWLKFVIYFDEGEEPRGFSFSVELLQMLAQLGASLEIDAIHTP